MGTNAVSVVLECQRPVIIKSYEHYFNKMRDFICAGFPVRNPRSGDITGVFCVSLFGIAIPEVLYEKAKVSVKIIENNIAAASRREDTEERKFFSEIVHESRNALTACQGFIQFMLIKRIFNSEYLDIVLSELARTISILNSYKFISAPQRSTELCKLNSCINDICTILSSKLNLRRIDINLSLSDIPDIAVDPSKIKQVLLNIIENAIDAIEKEGSILIATESNNKCVTITIKDSGCGIDDCTREKLFTPFFTTKPKGTGLGLHICKTIVESYGGSISLSSTPGIGTTFTIKFPY